MSEVISAVYEGNSLVRLEREPKEVKPQERLTVLIVPVPARKELSVEKIGIQGLRQQLRDFEARYSLKTPEFYALFLRGEMGDNRDFVVWAGLHELLQRMTPPHHKHIGPDETPEASEPPTLNQVFREVEQVLIATE